MRNFKIKIEYRSSRDDVSRDFFIPIMSEAILYRRAVGFFSSSIFAEISEGICSIADRGGKIQIVTSPEISAEDLRAIRAGYRRRLEDRSLVNYRSLKPPELLEALIADEILDIRIAHMKNGIYHEKFGLFEDRDGNCIAFSGSMNESRKAIRLNYESIDVFCSWIDRERVQLKRDAFDRIWNNLEPRIDVLEISDFDLNFTETPSPPKNLPIDLHDYQWQAVLKWLEQNGRGIFDMATGTGKTFTALTAISMLKEKLEDHLAIIVVCPYRHLALQWIENLERFNIKPIVGYSGSFQTDWESRLTKAIRDQKIRPEDRSSFCFLCVNKTFVSHQVQSLIDKIETPILLVVDEAHNLGSIGNLKFLDDRFTYRLGLSATFERYRDEFGTRNLFEFFGRKCIEYTLEDAIEAGNLCRYEYYPIVVYLSDEELEAYENLSREIAKCLIVGKNGDTKLNQRGEILAMQRSRIVAGAHEKLDALRDSIQPFIHDDGILIYCGSTNVEIDESEIRQIEAVTKILGNEFDMRAARFTAREDMEQRVMIREKFESGDLQAIVAIKCLDEGINIPRIKTAFILASTTNPREYIQRRGRVLRKSANKDIAKIFDFVTLPRNLDSVSYFTSDQLNRDLSLIRNEIARVKEFGRLSINSRLAWELIDEIQNAYPQTKFDQSSTDLEIDR